MRSLTRGKLAARAPISPEDAMRAFGATAARLCVSSGCDEGDPAVRRTLFEAACELEPSLKNRLWLAVGTPLPAAVTRFGMLLAGAPRRAARAFVQRVRAQLHYLVIQS